MLDKQRAEQYSKFKEIISNQTSNTDHFSVSDTPRDQVLDRARLFINNIKEQQHDKIKTKQQNKFEQLYFKIHGCHHNLTRHPQNLDNIQQNSSHLGGQPCVSTSSSPSNSTTNSSLTTSTSTPRPSNNTTIHHPTMAKPTSINPNHSNTTTNHTDKWVINLSQTPLTTNQLLLLQKGPNFGITPKYPPIDAYITATELAANKLNNQKADEFRSHINRLLKEQQHQHHNNCNLNPAQCRALTQLKQDNNRVILTEDKGVAMVVMDKQEYTNKAQTVLNDTSTYKVLHKGPTPQLKNKLINLLKDIKQTGGLSTQKYKQLYPTSAIPPNFYCLPKIHKTGTPQTHSIQ